MEWISCCFPSLHSQMTLALCRAAARGSAGELWSGGSFSNPFCVAFFLLLALLDLQGLLQEQHLIKTGRASVPPGICSKAHQPLFLKKTPKINSKISLISLSMIQVKIYSRRLVSYNFFKSRLHLLCNISQGSVFFVNISRTPLC